MKYDLIIVGAGPAGIFTAIEYKKHNSGRKVLLIEKGKSMKNRICPKRTTGLCESCSPCNITTGFSGAGAFSDGKLILSAEIGGSLNEFVNAGDMAALIQYVDSIYLSYGADSRLYGCTESENAKGFKRNAAKCNLQFIESLIRHLGTEKCYEIFTLIEAELTASGIEISFNNPVSDILVRDGSVIGVIADRDYYSDRVVIAAGRDGAQWLMDICVRHRIEKSVGAIDIGVRVEVKNETMGWVNNDMYESKLIYHTPTYNDRVRTFCSNPSGMVSSEYYDGDMAVVNGHSYKSGNLRTGNTNFALLVSNYFTQPFKEPIEYGRYIARLGNLLSGNRVIVQRFGDLMRGRRSTHDRIRGNSIIPTLSDAVPGDLSLVLPYRIMVDIREMLAVLDKIFNGLAGDDTLLYGIEVKFYSNMIRVNRRFETAVHGLYVAGDGAGITRSLMQSSANGILLGRIL